MKKCCKNCYFNFEGTCYGNPKDEKTGRAFRRERTVWMETYWEKFTTSKKCNSWKWNRVLLTKNLKPPN